MTSDDMWVSKGLVFPVAATQALQRPVLGAGGNGEFGRRLPHAQ